MTKDTILVPATLSLAVDGLIRRKGQKETIRLLKRSLAYCSHWYARAIEGQSDGPCGQVFLLDECLEFALIADDDDVSEVLP